MLVIDAKEGVRENSRRHGYILSMLGIRQVVVVRQQDGPGRLQPGRTSTRSRRSTARSSRASAPFSRASSSPSRAVAGENLADAAGARRRPGTRGRRCSRLLDTLPKAPPRTTSRCACRCRRSTSSPSTATIAASSSGRIEAGKVSVGDKVVFSPSNKIATIKSIEALQRGAARRRIEAGWSTGLHADRGDLRHPRRGDEPRREAAARVDAAADQHHLAGRRSRSSRGATTS